MSQASTSRIGWASVTPALLWTLVFFVVPFVAMAVMSLTQKEGGFSLAAYAQFFQNPSYWRALVNSLEVTLIVTALSVILAYPFAWILAFIVPEREHVMFDLIWSSVGRRARLVMRIAGNLLVGGLAAVAIPGTWDYVRFMAREGTPVLNLPFMWVFLPFVFLMVALTLRCAWAIWQAVHGIGLDAELHLS